MEPTPRLFTISVQSCNFQFVLLFSGSMFWLCDVCLVRVAVVDRALKLN